MKDIGLNDSTSFDLLSTNERCFVAFTRDRLNGRGIRRDDIDHQLIHQNSGASSRRNGEDQDLKTNSLRQHRNEKCLEDSGGIYTIYFCFYPKEPLSYYASLDCVFSLKGKAISKRASKKILFHLECEKEQLLAI
jgi:hypothetical protein